MTLGTRSAALLRGTSRRPGCPLLPFSRPDTPIHCLCKPVEPFHENRACPKLFRLRVHPPKLATGEESRGLAPIEWYGPSGSSHQHHPQAAPPRLLECSSPFPERTPPQKSECPAGSRV